MAFFHFTSFLSFFGKIQKLNKSRDSVGSQSSRTVDEARSLRMFSRK